MKLSNNLNFPLGWIKCNIMSCSGITSSYYKVFVWRKIVSGRTVLSAHALPRAHKSTLYTIYNPNVNRLRTEAYDGGKQQRERGKKKLAGPSFCKQKCFTVGFYGVKRGSLR